MNTWNIQWKNPWKKTLALGCAAFLLGGSAWGYAAPTVTAASGAAYAANPQDAPMPLPLTEEEVSAQQLADAEYMALLWMRTSAEYRALCYQGYNAALMAIDRAQANPAARSGKPLAIVLDCDETVTDNTRAMAAAAAAGKDNMVAHLVRTAFDARMAGEDVPMALDAAYGDAAMHLRARLSYLSMIVTLAPLLGLLGTIFGMIQSFSIFNLQAGQPMAITGGIGEALIATATGLFVAIFALVVHTYYAQRMDTMLTLLERTINALCAGFAAADGGRSHAS